MLNPEQLEMFAQAVNVEQEKAEAKHQGWPTDAVHASAILNEEAGKLTQACIDYHYGHTPAEEAYERMAIMTLRVAAMSMRFWSALHEYKKPIKD